MTKEKTLADLEADLMAAHNELTNRRSAAKIASLHETESLNAVNDAQKRIDAHIEKLRDGSIYGTDWASRKRQWTIGAGERA